MDQRNKDWMTPRKVSSWGLVAIAVVCGVSFTFYDRQLNPVAEKNPPFVAFTKAVCLADGIVLGLTTVMLGRQSLT